MPSPDRPTSNHEYPSSAGRLRTETDQHKAVVAAIRQALEALLPDPFVTVASQLLVFYVPGDRRRHLAPDLFVAKGVAKRDRRNFLVWEEGKGPDFVLEVVTAASRVEDTEDKFRLYRDVLLVPEYFLFDPDRTSLEPPLQGYQLHNTGYVAIEPVNGALPSGVLGVHMKAEGKELRFFNPSAGHWLPTADELAQQARAERAEGEIEQLCRQIIHQQAAAGRALDAAVVRQAEAARSQEEAGQWQAHAARAVEQAIKQLAEAGKALEHAGKRQAEASRAQEEAVRQQAEVDRLREQVARLSAEAEVDRLKRELDSFRRNAPGPGK